MNLHLSLALIAIGVLTTLTADVLLIIGSRLGIAGPGPRRGGFDFIGRWFGYLVKGKFKHDDIITTPPLHAELPIGVVAHYIVGIVFCWAYFVLIDWLHSSASPLTAFLFGLATVVFPWFVMLPSQGMGWLGWTAPAPAHLTRASLYTHACFGLGLALWTSLISTS